jgi:glycosyltransferase involved in cell wall biosynthesis
LTDLASAVSVAFTLNPFESRGGGAHSFARVLADWLPRFGVEVVFDDAEAQALLVFAHVGTPRQLARARRRGVTILHRLDERLDPGEPRSRQDKHRYIARLNGYADLTIFQSEFVRGNMGPICTAPAGRVIHNGVEPRVFAPDGPRRPLDGEPVALHVSWSVGESKRLDRIDELLAVAPAGFRLYCVGRHQEAGVPCLGDPRVVLLGPQPRETVAALMRSADFLFFPSELEPCPNTPLEAMACGLPSLYHPSGGTPELLADAGVPMTGSLGHDLGRLLENRDILRERALARAPRFGAERAAAEYAAAIADTAPAPRVSGLRRLWSQCGS